MSDKPKRFHLFQVYGIELEYMIVDRDSLEVKPIADQLIKGELGEIGDEVVRGEVTWSNELVMHVIELKCSEPTADLFKLQQAFEENIKYINGQLEQFNAKLLPTAAHPWMNPENEAKLWPYGQKEVYETYDRIFGCKGHGWSNLQSVHINLPFYDDEEFAKLNAACRLVMPLIPALSASSPMFDLKTTDYLDTRMVFYENNQKRIPSIVGKIVPERAFSRHSFNKMVIEKIKAEIEPLDTLKVLDPVWVNSRGAMARFDRGTIEIRIIDIQESPAMDIAIASLIINLIKLVVSEQHISLHDQMNWETKALYDILKSTIKDGQNAIITNRDYLKSFGLADWPQLTARQFWIYLFDQINDWKPGTLDPWEVEIKTILKHGTLSTRILDSLKGDFSKSTVKKLYSDLAIHLESNKPFIPWS
ncbi:MAG: glutamate-cysteine ligase family protein [Cyclobacteriaceae bacterium]